MDQLPRQVAEIIERGFAGYNAAFRAITRSTAERFRRCDWPGARRDAVARIELYDEAIAATREQLQALLGERLTDRSIWQAARAPYLELLGDHIDRELNKTYFNSLSRRLLGTVGVDSAVEFVDLEQDPTAHVRQQISIKRYPFDGALGATCRRLLEDCPVDAPWQDQGGCAAYVHGELRRQLARLGGTGAIDHFELVEPLFYRYTRAFIVGRIALTHGQVPLMIALVHGPGGVMVDRVLTSPDMASALFSYTRSYFHVDLETVGDTVSFLKRIMPHKPIGELYTALGRAKQGKTERYRGIFRHLDRTNDRFIPAPGSRGMVMAVFTLEDYDVVFKVIRDRFAYPKQVKRREVLEKYQMVFKHDRGGRLIDAQEFRHLKFDRRRFSPEVLDELLTECRGSISIDGEQLVLHHLYIERRLHPLNLYLNTIDPWETERVIIDYGQAIRDLALSNIFPGDLLMKNFGVSKQGRVIFYDYDELCEITDCNFRRLPPPRDDLEAMSADLWFNVEQNDIFPEQFVSFMGLSKEQLALFKRYHGEILAPEFWQRVRRRLDASEVVDVAPYARGRTSL